MLSSPTATPSIFTQLIKKLVQLEKTCFGALLFYLILLSLEKVLVPTTKSTHITVSLFNIPSQTSFILKVQFYPCNCIYIKGFHWQSCAR